MPGGSRSWSARASGRRSGTAAERGAGALARRGGAGYADEDWARPTAQRWTALRGEAQERLYAARLDQGDDGVLIAELEAFVEPAPLREERWRLLALALYRAHRQADALAALRRVRALLADELGVDPSPALRSLEEQILDQSNTLVPAPHRPNSTGERTRGSSPHRRRRPLSTPPVDQRHRRAG